MRHSRWSGHDHQCPYSELFPLLCCQHKCHMGPTVNLQRITLGHVTLATSSPRSTGFSIPRKRTGDPSPTAYLSSRLLDEFHSREDPVAIGSDFGNCDKTTF
jgi:hypothetical protein